MVEDDAERVDWGNDDDEQQASGNSYQGYQPRQATGEYPGEDAEDAVSLGGDDEDEREFYGHSSTEPVFAVSAVLTKTATTTVAHSHPAKRDSQRQSNQTSQRARTPSQTKNPESPSGGLPRTNSAGTLPPMTHALPPKPGFAVPLDPPPSPPRPGIIASAMVHRQRKSNGSGKTNPASDGGDPLPPDWEIRYSRSGTKEPYYFNVKTEECTWTRPRLPPPSRSPSVKDRENGHPPSGRPSPDIPAAVWPDRSGRGQASHVSRRDVRSRDPSPPAPNGDLTYQDRHYRPGEASAPAGKGDTSDRRGDRSGARAAYQAEAPYGRPRSPSPKVTTGGRRLTRSASPPWDRVPRRDLTPPPPGPRTGLRDGPRDFPQDRAHDAGWGRSQRPDGLDNVQPAPRSPPSHRSRRKDDIEPPLRRRKDDIDPPTRRKDDFEPPIRRKDDVESPLRRKDDIEPPLRPLPRTQTTTRHANDEWPASRPRSPPAHFREPSPPRRPGPPSFPSAGSLSATASSNARDAPRHERGSSPPRYPPRDPSLNPPTGNLPLRRTRDGDFAESAYDNSKRRRLDEDSGPPRRHPSDLPPLAASLPAKPIGAAFPPELSQIDGPHRKRAPLPPQEQQWRENKRHPAPGLPPGPYDSTPAAASSRISRPPLEDIGRKPYGSPADALTDRREDRFRMPVEDLPRRTGRSPPRGIDADREPRPPTGPGERRSRFDGPPPPERMDIDIAPPPRMPPASRPVGGMHADRMLAEPPRGPRAMAPRDGPGGPYPAVPPSPAVAQGPASPYNARMPAPGLPDPPLTGRGRGRPIDRRWEANDLGRRPSFSGPPPSESTDIPPRRVDDALNVPRDLPDRPPPRVPPVPDRRDDRAHPPRISGTNNVPIGARPSGYASDTQVPNPIRSPVDRFRPTDSYADLPRRPAQAETDPYDRRRQPLPPPDLPPPGPPRNDRAGRGPSATQDVPPRGRGPESVIDRPINALPLRPRDGPPRDAAPPRQSRFGSTPSAPPETEPRIWQTRDEAQSARTQDVRPYDGRPPREDTRPPRSGGPWEPYAEPPPRRWASSSDSYAPGPGGLESSSSRTRSPEVPLRGRTPPPPPQAEARRYEPLVEHPVAGKVHPERARLLAVQTSLPSDDADRSKSGRGRRPGRSPDRGFVERMRPPEMDRGLPPRPTDDARLGPPPRDRSPPPSQNGHRPSVKRGGSLLERLTLDDAAPPHDSGSSLRDRVDLHPQGSNEEVAPAHAESMDVDPEGSGHGDESQKAGIGRGQGRRRAGKTRRGRKNGGP